MHNIRLHSPLAHSTNGQTGQGAGGGRKEAKKHRRQTGLSQEPEQGRETEQGRNILRTEYSVASRTLMQPEHVFHVSGSRVCTYQDHVVARVYSSTLP